jgi:hypothetical protein
MEAKSRPMVNTWYATTAFCFTPPFLQESLNQLASFVDSLLFHIPRGYLEARQPLRTRLESQSDSYPHPAIDNTPLPTPHY